MARRLKKERFKEWSGFFIGFPLVRVRFHGLKHTEGCLDFVRRQFSCHALNRLLIGRQDALPQFCARGRQADAIGAAVAGHIVTANPSVFVHPAEKGG